MAVFKPNFLSLLFILCKALLKRKLVKIMIPPDLRFTSYKIFKVIWFHF